MAGVTNLHQEMATCDTKYRLFIHIQYYLSRMDVPAAMESGDEKLTSYKYYKPHLALIICVLDNPPHVCCLVLKGVESKRT